MQDEQWVLTAPAVRPGTGFRSLSLSVLTAAAAPLALAPAPAQSAADLGGSHKWEEWGSGAAPVRIQSQWARPGPRGGTAKCPRREASRALTRWRLCPPATPSNIVKTLAARPRIVPVPARVSMTPATHGMTIELWVLLGDNKGMQSNFNVAIKRECHQSSQCNKIYLKAVYCIEYCYYIFWNVINNAWCAIRLNSSVRNILSEQKLEGKLQAPTHTTNTFLSLIWLIIFCEHYFYYSYIIMWIFHKENKCSSIKVLNKLYRCRQEFFIPIDDERSK